ncbi:MAG: zinc ABC transporter solute-binding protein [Alkalinema sp. RU_4_3]|nr:zinc ABC transporter solute-binding protein [Alkalinema sp. RU_4_3]
MTAKTAPIAEMALMSLLFGACSSPPPQTTTQTSPAPIVAPSPPSAANRPLVVATTSVVCDLTRQIAAETVDLKCLVAAGTDPHGYEPKPDDRKAIEQAKLILYSGYNFEHDLVKLIQATANPAPKVAVNELAVPNPEKFEEDGQTESDPHVFHSAANGVQTAEVINKNLGQMFPANAVIYIANTKKLTEELTQINAWIQSQIATIPAAQRKLVTTHDAFGYYSKAYGIPVVGALQGISTDEKPTPTRVKELVQEIKTAAVPTIFAEASINPQLLEAVAKEANVKIADQVMFADGLGEKGSPADTYQNFFIANTKTIVEGLGGKYTPFAAK